MVLQPIPEIPVRGGLLGAGFQELLKRRSRRIGIDTTRCLDCLDERFSRSALFACQIVERWRRLAITLQVFQVRFLEHPELVMFGRHWSPPSCMSSDVNGLFVSVSRRFTASRNI